MISDAELLKLVMERYPEQPTPFIIEQFTVLKAGLIQANNKLAAMDMGRTCLRTSDHRRTHAGSC